MSLDDKPGLCVGVSEGFERSIMTAPIAGYDGWLMYEMPINHLACQGHSPVEVFRVHEGS
ncbi:hypothetical protein FRC12_005215 [Ceratobasidium sp. 428]|nr:hypothetical protein FRC12_005215 [Ceratobasidium sp. 428]